MKIKELISELQKHNPELEVMLPSNIGDARPLESEDIYSVAVKNEHYDYVNLNPINFCHEDEEGAYIVLMLS